MAIAAEKQSQKMERSKSLALLESEFDDKTVLAKKGRELLQRDLIKKKCSFAKDKEYTFMLFNDALAYAHTDKKSNKLVLHSLFPVAKDTVSCQFTKARSPPHKLVVESKASKPLTLYFDDFEVAQSWLKSLSTLGDAREPQRVNSTHDVLAAIAGSTSNSDIDAEAEGTSKEKKAVAEEEAVAGVTAAAAVVVDDVGVEEVKHEGEPTPCKSATMAATETCDEDEIEPGAPAPTVTLIVSDPHHVDEEVPSSDAEKKENQPSTLTTASSMIKLADAAWDVPVWVPDADSDQCMICQDEWSFFNRRHHCRACGLLVCGDCSPHRLVLTNLHPSDKQRVCNPCNSNLAVHGED